MKTVEIKIFKRVINNMEEYNEFIKDCESEEYNRSLLEQFLLNKQYPKAISYKEAIEKLKSDFPVEITFNKNNTFNLNRISVKKL